MSNPPSHIDDPEPTALASTEAPDLPQCPFGDLALTLSGGGYRAAAFHLGALDTLNELGLLGGVRVMSTVSGGTLTGLLYAVSIAEHQSYPAFYEKAYDFLKNTNVIRDAFQKMGAQNSGNLAPFPSLIRSAADVYDSLNVFGGRTFSLLLNSNEPQLNELSFNATEFRSGNSFRFQKSQSALASIGNGRLEVKRELAGQIRLADIAAASSCFPGGFEPIRFPDDFRWQTELEGIRDELGRDKFEPCVPLMDGGIFDNQGVDSLVQTYKRRGNDVGLVIISDTSQGSDSLFEFPVMVNSSRRWLTLVNLAKGAWMVFFIAALTILTLVVDMIKSLGTQGLRLPEDIFLYLVPLLLSLLVIGLLIWLRLVVRRGLRLVHEKVGIELWASMKDLTVYELIGLLNGRVSSVLALTSSVFMKRIRSMIYKDISVYGKYKNRLVINLIYDLKNTSLKALFAKAPWLMPSPKLQNLAKRAEAMDTTLWFSNEAELETLVACGRATMCFNILRYIVGLRGEYLHPDSGISQVLNRARTVWKSFNEPVTSGSKECGDDLSRRSSTVRN